MTIVLASDFRDWWERDPTSVIPAGNLQYIR